MASAEEFQEFVPGRAQVGGVWARDMSMRRSQPGIRLWLAEAKHAGGYQTVERVFVAIRIMDESPAFAGWSHSLWVRSA